MPVPLIVIQGVLVVAVHAQPPALVMVTVPGPPAAPIACVAGLTPNVQGAPACAIVNGWPPIIRVPVRERLDALADTAYDTDPSPVPFAPLVIVIHESADEAVHAHPPNAATATEPVVAAAGTEAPEGLST